MKQQKEILDFCRVKKLFDKGFGFLSSIHFQENVFFHFSRIRDEETRIKLENIKRGVVYVFFTSELKDNKRRVNKIWTDINKVYENLLPQFCKDVLHEFEHGLLNPYETAYVLKLLREQNISTEEYLNEILNTQRVNKNKHLIKAILSEQEFKKIDDWDDFIKEVESKKNWKSLVLKTIAPE